MPLCEIFFDDTNVRLSPQDNAEPSRMERKLDEGHDGELLFIEAEST